MRELFSQNEIRGLLQQDEGQFLEFKSLWDLSARLVDEGLLVQKGERKAAHYVAGTGLVPRQ